jgi:hypothetical protein
MKKSFQTLFLLTTALGSAPALAVDLLDIYRDAQLRDARFGAARAQYQAQQERLPQGVLEQPGRNTRRSKNACRKREPGCCPTLILMPATTTTTLTLNTALNGLTRAGATTMPTTTALT